MVNSQILYVLVHFVEFKLERDSLKIFTSAFKWKVAIIWKKNWRKTQMDLGWAQKH